VQLQKMEQKVWEEKSLLWRAEKKGGCPVPKTLAGDQAIGEGRGGTWTSGREF